MTRRFNIKKQTVILLLGLALTYTYSFCAVNTLGSDAFDTLNLFMNPRLQDSLMRHYERTGYNYLKDGNYDSADYYLLKELEIKRIILSPTDIKLGNLYVNLGVLNFRIWRFEEALEYYRKAEEIYRGIDINYIDLGSIYVNEAIIYRLLGDYEKAELHCNNAIRIFSRQKKINYDYLKIAYYNLGLINQNTENYERAIESFTKCINYSRDRDTLNLLNSVSGIALCYEKLDKDSLAMHFHKTAINIAESFYGINSPEIADYLMNFGIFKIEKLGELNEGKELYDIALIKYKEMSGMKSEKTSRCLYNLGEYYYLYENSVSKSLQLLQQSLIAAESNFNDTSVYTNPQVNTDRLNIRLLETIKLKGLVLLSMYYETGILRYLVASLETYDLALQNIDKMRVRYGSEDSRLIISKQQFKTFQEAIHVANLLYSITDNPEYLQKSLEYNEKAKSFSLLIAIRNLKAKQFGGIPPELLEREKDVSRQLSLYEELIFEEKKKESPDQTKLEIWEERLFWLRQENQQLLHNFEQSFPQYYQLKYDTKVITINKIVSSLGNNEVLLEYTLTDSILFIYSFLSNSYKLYNIRIDSTFYNHLDLVRTSLSTPRFSSDVSDIYNKFCISSHQLYRFLIEPCYDRIHNKTLIIIPDGQLSYIPFESLLVHPLFSNNVDYRNLPYLIRDYPVSYAYSATLHFESKQRQSRPEKELLAFAPSYSSLIAQNIVQPNTDFLEQYREHLVPIPGVKDEVKMINRLVEGDIYLDKEATETRFKQTAEHYDILHLAMHTIVNNEDPMYSKLAFVQNVDSLNDGFLNTYEIYNMRFNARMAVLSSCKTGFGKLMKGEGVMSLARGFMYAGCPSIIMTLWEVSDKSGAKLMQDFYQSLIRGKSKARALQEAKLNFLKKADNLKANPYFWSTYVIIGDASPIYKKDRNYLYWIGAIVLLSGIGLFLFLRYQRNKNRKGKGFQPDTMYS